MLTDESGFPSGFGRFGLESFYRTMHFSAKRGIAIVYCPSVCLSVTFRYRDGVIK